MFFAGTDAVVGEQVRRLAGSPRIRRSKSACARSMRASRSVKFRSLVSDERRKLAARAKQEAADGTARKAPAAAPAATDGASAGHGRDARHARGHGHPNYRNFARRDPAWLPLNRMPPIAR